MREPSAVQSTVPAYRGGIGVERGPQPEKVTLVMDAEQVTLRMDEEE